MVTCVPWIFLSWTFTKMVDLNNPDNEYSAINSMQGLDYGTAMAYSYYYGYLKLVLPSTGTQSKGLIEKIENIEDQHNITIAVHKLLILIPSSLYIPPDLKDISNRWMESAIDLEAEIRDRAGTKRRQYHNNVYKIYFNGERFTSEPLYVIVEGATPLLTFFEVQKHNHPETKLYRKFYKNIVKNFHDKLKELLDNDPECSELCELIYYDDYDDKNNKVNVAKIIWNRISNSKVE
ncbi:stimulator of interferon genes protein [Colletes gigas]|uniref:stimulator of interferon genes protein n=1 Tax=Colletes gigas TaxID=935657 RepID=UPI001C9B5577|nr:stimulator of interferon genes protein [Colletes gigas]